MTCARSRLCDCGRSMPLQFSWEVLAEATPERRQRSAFDALRDHDQPAGLYVAFPGILNLGERNPLGLDAQFAARCVVHHCWNASVSTSQGGMPAVPRIVSAVLRSTAAGSLIVGPALSPTSTSRVSDPATANSAPCKGRQ